MTDVMPMHGKIKFKILHQIRERAPELQELVKKLHPSSDDEWDTLEAWMRLMIACELIGNMMRGQLNDAFTSPFPLGTECNVALEVGSPVYQDISKLSEQSWGKYAIALLVHLRFALSRTRILVPVGLPDSCKSTLMKD